MSCNAVYTVQIIHLIDYFSLTLSPAAEMCSFFNPVLVSLTKSLLYKEFINNLFLGSTWVVWAFASKYLN